jgi:hypothetical protein
MTPLNWTFLNVVVVVTDTTASKKVYKKYTENSKVDMYKSFYLCIQK